MLSSVYSSLLALLKWRIGASRPLPSPSVRRTVAPGRSREGGEAPTGRMARAYARGAIITAQKAHRWQRNRARSGRVGSRLPTAVPSVSLPTAGLFDAAAVKVRSCAHTHGRALRTSELRERDQRALPGQVSTPAKRHTPPSSTRSPVLLPVSQAPAAGPVSALTIALTIQSATAEPTGTRVTTQPRTPPVPLRHAPSSSRDRRAGRANRPWTTDAGAQQLQASGPRAHAGPHRARRAARVAHACSRRAGRDVERARPHGDEAAQCASHRRCALA